MKPSLIIISAFLIGLVLAIIAFMLVYPVFWIAGVMSATLFGLLGGFWWGY